MCVSKLNRRHLSSLSMDTLHWLYFRNQRDEEIWSISIDCAQQRNISKLRIETDCDLWSIDSNQIRTINNAQKMSRPVNCIVINKVSKVKLSRNRPWRPIGLWDVKDPALSRQSDQMVVRLSALRTCRTLLPTNIILMLLVLISVRGWVNPRA
jgi:hypothetical protein